MGTRSTIAILRADGSVSQIYCHWDGYLEHNGRILLDHYNTAEKVEELIALGDLSSLGREIGVKHPFSPDYNIPGDSDKWNDLYRMMCTAYGRDRGEAGTQPNRYRDLESYEDGAQFEDFNYVFMHGQWAVASAYSVPEAGIREGEVKLLADCITTPAAVQKVQQAA